MDHKFVLNIVATRANGEMLGTVPGNLREMFANEVADGHLEVMRAPDATTVIGHRITDSGRAYLSSEATEPTPAPPPADSAEEPVPTPAPEPAPPPETETPAPAVTEPPATTTTEPEAKPAS